jgi:hypothetical protein
MNPTAGIEQKPDFSINMDVTIVSDCLIPNRLGELSV